MQQWFHFKTWMFSTLIKLFEFLACRMYHCLLSICIVDFIATLHFSLLSDWIICCVKLQEENIQTSIFSNYYGYVNITFLTFCYLSKTLCFVEVIKVAFVSFFKFCCFLSFIVFFNRFYSVYFILIASYSIFEPNLSIPLNFC